MYFIYTIKKEYKIFRFEYFFIMLGKSLKSDRESEFANKRAGLYFDWNSSLKLILQAKPFSHAWCLTSEVKWVVDKFRMTPWGYTTIVVLLLYFLDYCTLVSLFLAVATQECVTSGSKSKSTSCLLLYYYITDARPTYIVTKWFKKVPY